MAQACLGAITGPDGATESQLTILHAIACNFWGLDPADLTPESALTAEQAAAGITVEQPRRRTREMLVMLELCRHPLESSHEQRIAEYCFALGGDGPGMSIARKLVSNGADAALEDYMRRFFEKAVDMMEPAMIEIAAAEEEEAAKRLAEIDAAVHAAAPGTLGAEFVAFYERNGFTIDAGSVHLFGHDMAHVIGGYDATPVGEISIGAMKLMITDSDIHWIEFLGNLLIHETGMVPEGYKSHEAALTDPESIRQVIRAMERGRETQKDFSNVDHLSMIDWPFEDVRAEFGVPPL
jgi:hypothetical protein